MRPIDTGTPLDPTAVMVPPDLNPNPAKSPTATTAVEQQAELVNPKTIVGQRVERDLERAYFKGELDKAESRPQPRVLYDNKPGKTGATDEVPPPPQIGDGTSDELNQEVASNAAHMVGQHVVGPIGEDYSKKPDDAECFYMVDSLLRAGAKSRADFGKITKDADYQWSAKKIDLNDVKPGDVLQSRNQKIAITTAIIIKKTCPDGHVVTTHGGDTKTLSRGFPNHASVVLSNDGDGKFTVAEQHVIDHNTGKESTTVRKNTLYTKDVPATTTNKPPRWEKEGSQDVKIEETTTVTITVEGQISAYRPQKKGT